MESETLFIEFVSTSKDLGEKRKEKRRPRKPRNFQACEVSIQWLLNAVVEASIEESLLVRLRSHAYNPTLNTSHSTFGYVAPEYAMTCRVSEKADVYSYGVVLLELISDKKPLDPSFSSHENGFNIVSWACMLLQHGQAKEVFTTGLWDSGPHDDLVDMLYLAVTCTVDSLSSRPTMRQVVQRLKRIQPS
ncbi:hypothetical protein DKX38_022238 [Salix brachista]|uniref:Protein kinase domain-containing protein n=1 Tax=Salix brachista TaxID=2182728 RepID=A0A5N5JZ65_9ROSI|nr:hypothetical protein DKX38_022238 [Salix brachista]